LLLPILQPISIAFYYIIPSSPDDSRINNSDCSRKLGADSLPPLAPRPTALPRNKTPQKKKKKKNSNKTPKKKEEEEEEEEEDEESATSE
jgi:hypothetical protein